MVVVLVVVLIGVRHGLNLASFGGFMVLARGRDRKCDKIWYADLGRIQGMDRWNPSSSPHRLKWFWHLPSSP